MSDAIGALKARVLLQSPARNADDLGGAAITWTNQGEVWARIEAQGASLADDFGASTAVSAFGVTINRRADVRAGWRVVWGERVFRVTGVRDDGAPRMLLDCEEEHS